MRAANTVIIGILFFMMACSENKSEPEMTLDASAPLLDALVRPDREMKYPDTGVRSFGQDAGAFDSGEMPSEDGSVMPTPPPLGYVEIVAGTFSRGSPMAELGRKPHEGPEHTVTLTRNYYLKETEVTQEEWLLHMPINPSVSSTCAQCPVDTTTRFNAQEYMNKLSEAEFLTPCYDVRGEFVGTDCPGYRFPTEAEWEFAARAGMPTAFFNGDIIALGCDWEPNLEKIGWYCGNLDPSMGTKPVRSRDPNPWGLYDMHGNVMEWVHDFYAPYENQAQTDPQGPVVSGAFVARGGAIWLGAEHCRSASRRDIPTTHPLTGISLGFRVARTVMP
jgi:formylglycine-generating enzyme required for sulfatase activity